MSIPTMKHEQTPFVHAYPSAYGASPQAGFGAAAPVAPKRSTLSKILKGEEEIDKVYQFGVKINRSYRGGPIGLPDPCF